MPDLLGHEHYNLPDSSDAEIVIRFTRYYASYFKLNHIKYFKHMEYDFI